MTEKWIQKALPKSSKGKLHKEMGIPEDKKIPEKKLAKAAQSKGKLGKRARLAETLKGMKHGNKKEMSHVSAKRISDYGKKKK